LTDQSEPCSFAPGVRLRTVAGGTDERVRVLSENAIALKRQSSNFERE
jgi:hypothetical protein